jgi:hypothetical protein
MFSRKALTRVQAVIIVILVVAAVAVGGLVPAASADEGPFGPIRVATNRSRYSGSGCPIQIVFTASINFVMPHPQGFVFNYHWERSDGAKGPVRVVRPGAGQGSMVIRDTWRLGAPGNQYNVSETLFVNSGNTHLSESSPVVTVTCK